MKLDENKVQYIGVIKRLSLTIFDCPSITVTQEVVIIDIPLSSAFVCLEILLLI